MGASKEEWSQLVAALEKGDAVAFVRVHRIVTGSLARLGAYDWRDSWDDVCQEVMIALLRTLRRDGLDDSRAFVRYVETVTRNKFLNWIERQGKARGREIHLEPERVEQRALPMPCEPPPLDTLLDLDHAVDALPGRLRHVVQCIYLEGCTYTEAAERLGLSLAALKRAQNQGLKELRKKMRVSP